MTSFDGNNFAYDARGRRTAKNGITFTYDSNGNLIKQSNGLEFFYDHTGVFAVKYDGSTYFYRKDVLGNVVKILDNTGAVVVEYKYDAWGNCKVLDANGSEISNTAHIGILNPFRYRGYYFDTETGFYFLKTRYYDPEIGRFTTIDDLGYLCPDAVNGVNLYAYCSNNPINYVDQTGQGAILVWLGKAFVSGLISAGANLLGQIIFNDATWDTIQWEKVASAGISGFVSGLIPGSSFASIAGRAFASSLVENGLNAIWLGDKFNMGTVVKDAVVSIVTSCVINGLTSMTSKLTSKMFLKAPNYSQYQHYYRKLGYDYTRQEIYKIMGKHGFYKRGADEIINKLFDFAFSFATYRI